MVKHLSISLNILSIRWKGENKYVERNVKLIGYSIGCA